MIVSMRSRSFIVDNLETEIAVGERIAGDCARLMNSQPKLIFVPSGLPKRMKDYIAESFSSSDLIEVEDGEGMKSMDGLAGILSSLASHRVDRSDTIGYAGGGTIGDTVGFAASIFKRGIDFVALPTTFLAQIDSAIGGKNGINFQAYKNMIGTFHLPSKIISDVFFLSGMSEIMLRSGLGELIKYFILEPEKFAPFLSSGNVMQTVRSNLETLVFLCSEVKMEYVSRDFRDRLGIRMMLNMGHTVAHALESSSGFSMSHGDSVYWGMLIEAKLVQMMGTDSSDVILNLKRFLTVFKQSRDALQSNIDSLAKYMDNDKKVAGGQVRIPFPLPGKRANVIRMDVGWIGKMLDSNFLDDLLD